MDIQPLHDEIREAKKERFLLAFAEQGTIKQAAQVAGVHRDTFYAWFQVDYTFQKKFEQAIADYRDTIRDEIHRRAIEGVPSQLYWQGQPVYDASGNPVMTVKKSDALLAMLAKTLPEFKDKPIEQIHTPVLNEHSFTIEDVRALDDDVLEALIENMQRLQRERTNTVNSDIRRNPTE